MSRGLNRANRLQEMERLYFLRAYSDSEMGEHFGVDRTVIFKDRIEMETEGGLPFSEEERGRYRIDRQRYLSNIRVSLPEALALYLPARRAARQTLSAQPHVASALEKLALALKQPMTERLVKAANIILKQTAQSERVAIMETVTRAWVEQIPLRLAYQGLHGHKPLNYTIQPYLIEPALWSDGAYVIGPSDVHGEVAIFKLERIVSASLGTGTFALPENFDEQELLKYAWGVWRGEGEPVWVKLRFAPGDAARRVKETIWHPQQKPFVDMPDGGCIWEAQVSEPREMIPWIRGWGSDVEVLEPKELRDIIQAEIRRMVRRYGLEATNSSSPTARVLRCWGKTKRNNKSPDIFHPALFHMLDVGHVAQELLSPQSSPRWQRVLANALGSETATLLDWVPWFVALHDIGKISAAFQEQNEVQRMRLKAEGFLFGNRPWNNIPYHTLIGQVFLVDEIGLPLPDYLKQAWQEMVGGHHGQFAQPSDLREAQNKLKAGPEPEEWRTLRIQAANLLMTHLLRQTPTLWPEPSNISVATMTLTGFTILCDWLGSDGARFPIQPDTPLDEYLPDSIRRAREAVEQAGFFQPSQSVTPTNFTSLFPQRQPPRPLQTAIDEIPASVLAGPCLAVIEAPTGEGKTEAALTLAHRLAQAHGTDELYYALPTTATSNQMFGRLQNYLYDGLKLTTQVKLIHGQAFLYEDDLRIEPLSNGKEPTPASEWFGPKKRALLAPFGVGTIDQIELAALNVRHTALRLVGLAGKVVIVDEVHAYDTYMTTIVERLLNWLAALGASVILLSATLPKARRAKLAQAYGAQLDTTMEADATYPSLWVVGQKESYHVTPAVQQLNRRLIVNTDSLHFGDDEAEAKARWLLEAVAQGGCACWMTNTVARAQKIFEFVDKYAQPDIDRSLLHAQFPLEERQSREEEIARKYGPGQEYRPQRGIVIGTQVLEQSLDLDFDVMVSDLAPVDLLLQRAGRLHRHERLRPAAHAAPRLWLNTQQDTEGRLILGVDKYIYAEFILRQTWKTLAGRTEVNLPTDYRPLVEAVYGIEEPASDAPLVEAWEKLQTQESNATGKANERLLPEPNPEDSFCGPAARLMFEESENGAAWVVAQTRLGEESVTIIPLERNEAVTWFYSSGAKVEVSLDSEAPREMQLRLLRRSLRVSNRKAVKAINDNIEKPPRLFTESALLKESLPLWLTDGKARLSSGKTTIQLTLDPELGLVIDKDGGE